MKLKRREVGYKEWWNWSCTKMKRKVCREYRRWKKGKISRGKYMEERKSMKEHFEKRKKEKREEEGEELKNLKNEKEIWEFINRKRGKRKQVKNKIDKGRWMKYFMELLEEKEEKAEEEDERRVSTQGKEKEEERRKQEGMQILLITCVMQGSLSMRLP